MPDTSEKNFETVIEALLLAGGPDDPEPARSLSERATSYQTDEPALSVAEGPALSVAEWVGGYYKRASEAYDKALCLLTQDTLDFIFVTQPREWQKLKKNVPNNPEDHLLARLSDEIRKHGSLHVLRNGIRTLGCKFDLAYFPPVSGLNPELQRLYQGNIFSVVRQLKYSLKNENSLDLVLFLNGLPLFTAELKNPLTGQNVQHAIRQYRQDRDPSAGLRAGPREPLFAFRRCLAHFAIDPDLVFFSTRLAGPATRFFPFNRGDKNGAGNPATWRGFASAYLWEQVWTRPSLLNLIQYFIHEYDVEQEDGKKTGERALIFPRYHQLDSVRRLVVSARDLGPGHRYLIQHSAGSGKSNSIAWLAHQLSVLHNAADQPIFDSVVVITDRRILDRQLRRTVLAFEQTAGMVQPVTEGSRQLKQSLELGKKIITTTLQKFPVISEQMRAIPGKRFAIIIDEAHSSQSGESMRHLNKVLSANSLEEAEQLDAERDAEEAEDEVIREIKARGHLPNASYFAFTATPKKQTLELFGHKSEDGSFEAFSLYTMRQAIDEGFILDVLQNYTTYQTYWNLLKKIQDDPQYDNLKAKKLLLAFVDLHQHTIGKKIEIMVGHFINQAQFQIGGRAKAMIVTRSRLHAVHYKLAIDAHLRALGSPFKALVAFSGTVKDKGLEYTESGMNGFPETKTAETFKQDDYKILIVAEKFQTGFDQPLLHSMYVDKRLNGLHAVQTLSRLNRTHPDKTETFVLDFVNSAEDIAKSFQPYYERTILSEATNPDQLYDLQTELAAFRFYDRDQIERFAAIYYASDEKSQRDKHPQLHNVLSPSVEAFLAADKETKITFRERVDKFTRFYGFLSQIIPFTDADLEKLYTFLRLLRRRLPIEREKLPYEIQQAIDIENLTVRQTGKGKIQLKRKTGQLDPDTVGQPGGLPESEMEALSEIIKELNERFSTEFSEEDRLVIHQIEQKLAQDGRLGQTLRVNTPENAMLAFRQVLQELFQDMLETNFKFYQNMDNNPDFAERLTAILFERYRKSMQNGVAG
jgi:type I restriction enzyme, R subunit